MTALCIQAILYACSLPGASAHGLVNPRLRAQAAGSFLKFVIRAIEVANKEKPGLHTTSSSIKQSSQSNDSDFDDLETDEPSEKPSRRSQRIDATKLNPAMLQQLVRAFQDCIGLFFQWLVSILKRLGFISSNDFIYLCCDFSQESDPLETIIDAMVGLVYLSEIKSSGFSGKLHCGIRISLFRLHECF